MVSNGFSCLEGVLEVDEDPEDELDKPGTTIGTKFSVLSIHLFTMVFNF